MSLPDYFHNIRTYLFAYADHLNYTNSVGLGDYNIFAENLFKDLLNVLFDWNLINANSQKRNQKSYDLVSKSKNIYIQVTANKNHKSKYDKSVRSFKDFAKDGDHFIVFFIAKNVNKNILKLNNVEGVIYEAYDLSKLMDTILFDCSEAGKLMMINNILANSLHAKLYEQLPTITHQANLEIPIQRINDNYPEVYIHRENLTKLLYDFIQEKNGLLVGGPGYGKSFILEELQRYCRSRKQTCLIVRINDLTEGNNEEIGEELKLNKDWLAKLSHMKMNEEVAILVFDAYDTAKDEKLKSNILKAIKKSIEDLPANWRIIVSVRTYDATKSRKLLEMFPADDINNQISCRHFQIPEFSDSEVQQALCSIPKFQGVLEQCNVELIRLLRIPYFYNLFYKVLSGDKEKLREFIGIKSEEQLLNVFWINKIEDNWEKELFLKKLTSDLVKNSSLSCEKFSVVTAENATVFNELISSGVLEEVTVMKQKIAFTHNILLDFAISKYLLNLDVKKQLEFVSTNEKVPFIFRQSFIYFYTKLYKEDNVLFWHHYFKIVSKDTAVFRLFHQTSLIYVLVNCYTADEDLHIIFEEKEGNERGRIIRKLLEGIRFLTKGNIREKDVNLLLKISSNLHWICLWETNVLIEKSIEQFSVSGDLSVVEILSNASCNCFDFVWENRKTSQNKAVFDRNGGIRAIENICKTLPFNLLKAGGIFKNVLSLLSEDEFPIGYFNELADNILLIYQHDKDMAAQIYKTLYFHIEVSDKETNLGNSVVLALRSNRKQDYGMVHYALEEKFTELLNLDFDSALILGLEIYNIANNLDNDRLYKKANFKIGKNRLEICSDYSRYDYDSSNGPSSYMGKIMDVIRENLSSSATSSKAIYQIRKLMPELRHAMAWRRLIQILRMFPEKTKLISYQLLTKKEIYLFDETLYEVGELIKAVWPYLTYDKKEKVEKIVVSMLSNNEFADKPHIIINRVNQIINCISLEQAITEEAKKILAENEKIPNEPLVYEGNMLADVSYASREEKASMAGFNLNDVDDVLKYQKIEEIETFNNQYNNTEELPEKSDFKNILNYLEEIFLECSTWDTYKRKNAELEIARFISIFSKFGNQLSNNEHKLVKKIALNYIQNIDYRKTEYEYGNLSERVSVYGPDPRNISVLTLLRIMSTFKEKDVEDIVLKLMFDNEKIIRFQSLKGLKYFWKERREAYWNTVNKLSSVESDGRCFYELLLAVYPHEIMVENQKDVEDLVISVLSRLNTYTGTVAMEIWKVLVVILLKLIIYQDSSRARMLVSENKHIKAFSRSLIFEIMKIIDPHNENNNYKDNPEKHNELINILFELTTYRFERIHAKHLDSDYDLEDFEIVDYLIQHLYFTVDHGKGNNKGKFIPQDEKITFYKKIKPLINYVVEQSVALDSGYMLAHTGYYFMKMLNVLFVLDPENILDFSNKIVLCASKSGFSYDHTTLREIIKLTELILTDYREILYEKDNFNNLISVLDYFSNSGWQEAMEMTWRLKEAF
jgi:hypothetical protein